MLLPRAECISLSNTRGKSMSGKPDSVECMAKTVTQYLCSECGWTGSKWYGRCPECGQWGTIQEFHEARPSSNRVARSSQALHSGRTAGGVPKLQKAGTVGSVQPMTMVGTQDVDRLDTGFSEFNRVLGGGIVPGSVILIAGEPGIGKSTLLLETAGNIARSIPTHPTLYISGEESPSQVRLRASRVHAVEKNLLLEATTDLSTSLDAIEQAHPALVIVDSVQTIISQDSEGISGGSSQVREVAGALIDVAKTDDIPILLVGHVTKDGSIAGPRTLEHLVDVVCQFEGETQTALRVLHATKNRFGPTDEVGCFDMSGEGIEEVADPSGLFLSPTDAPVEGTCVTFTLDGHRSLPIEVQSLVTSSVLPAPRRATNGIDPNRLAMLTAVLYRHGGINLLANDLYVSTIAGGSAREPSCDLAVVAALASASRRTPIPRTTCAVGEISLTGQVRPVPQLSHRLEEAARLGFTTALVPEARGRERIPRSLGRLRVQQVSSILEALRALGIRQHSRAQG